MLGIIMLPLVLMKLRLLLQLLVVLLLVMPLQLLIERIHFWVRWFLLIGFC